MEDTVCPSSLTSLQGLGEPFPFSQAAVPCQAEAKAGRSGVGRAPGLGLHSRGYPEQEALPGQGWIATPGFIQCPSTHPQPRGFREGGRLIRWVPGSAGPCRQQMALARGSLQRIRGRARVQSVGRSKLCSDPRH